MLMELSLKLPTIFTMPHNKTVPQVKGDFLLGNLSQMIAIRFKRFVTGSAIMATWSASGWLPANFIYLVTQNLLNKP